MLPPSWRDPVLAWWQRLRYLGFRVKVDRCNESAAALTYMSLFALVPMLTVLYTMASAVPAFQGLEARLQDLLFDHLVPETSAGLQDYVSEFSRQAKNLTGFGLAFVGGTAILMLRNIEKTFNRIWRTPEHRSPVISFLLYWAVLSLGPLTIGLALGISTYLGAMAEAFSGVDALGLGAGILRLAPFLLSGAGFTLLYAAVPNCRVPLLHALIGGFLAALAFNVGRALFTELVVGSSITFIYGAFAAVPLFLLWIFISWNIVLIGAVLVHSFSAYESEAGARRPLILKALGALHTLWAAQRQGRSVRENEILGAYNRAIDSRSWGQLRELFLEERLIMRNERGHYLLARDLHDYSLAKLLEKLASSTTVDDDHPCEPKGDWEERARRLLRDSQLTSKRALAVSLHELFSTEEFS